MKLIWTTKLTTLDAMNGSPLIEYNELPMFKTNFTQIEILINNTTNAFGIEGLPTSGPPLENHWFTKELFGL